MSPTSLSHLQIPRNVFVQMSEMYFHTESEDWAVMSRVFPVKGNVAVIQASSFVTWNCIGPLSILRLLIKSEELVVMSHMFSPVKGVVTWPLFRVNILFSGTAENFPMVIIQE